MLIETEYANDIVFAKYLKYMTKAFKHKRASYINKEIQQNNIEVTVSNSKWNYVAVTAIDDNIESLLEELSFCAKSYDISLLNNALKTLSLKQNNTTKIYTHIYNKDVKESMLNSLLANFKMKDALNYEY